MHCMTLSVTSGSGGVTTGHATPCCVRLELSVTSGSGGVTTNKQYTWNWNLNSFSDLWIWRSYDHFRPMQYQANAFSDLWIWRSYDKAMHGFTRGLVLSVTSGSGGVTTGSILPLVHVVDFQ